MTLWDYVWMMVPNYVGYVAILGLGRLFNARQSWFKLLGGGLLGALIFYFISNTASWLTMPQYQKTLMGWIQALTTGLPGYPTTIEFFRNTLLSGGLFTGLFVGAVKLQDAAESAAEKREPAKKNEEEEEDQPQPEEAKA
jgi:hypothetical protein